MLFWLISALIGLISLAALLRPMMRNTTTGAKNSAASDLSVYRDQLRELEADVARGILAEEEAETSRVEISRRILAADARKSSQTSKAPQNATVGLVTGLALLAAITLFTYFQIGAPGAPDQPLQARLDNRLDQATAEARFKEMSQSAPRALDERETELLDQLRAALKERPDDLTGHRLLVQTLSSIEDFGPAWAAQVEVIRILGEEATSDDYGQQAELMIFAAGGYVSPTAEDVLAAALERDPTNQRARYYSGAALAQNGLPDNAMEIWANLISEGPEAAWKEPVREQMRALNANTGIPLPPGVAKGPSQEDIEAAQQMTEEDRQEMIRGMVEGLNARLAEEGGPPTDWARLITALTVLGQTDRARAIYEEALVDFADNPDAINLLNEAAQGLQ